MAIPSRELVSKELMALLISAAKQFPKLKGKEEYVIYGPSEQEYASFKNPKYFEHRGRKWDWQGLLGQKVPRFDNRIISKCRLIPRLNVCKADKMLNKEVSFLLSLKNMRYTLDNVTSKSLTCEQIKSLCEKYKGNISTKEKKTNKALINSREWKKYVQSLGGDINPDQIEIPQPKSSGRSSFCKPGLNVLKELILSGKSPHDYHSKLVKSNKNTDPLKGLVEDDYEFLSAMPKDWDSISIPDEREFDKELNKEEALCKIDKIISSISNRIVRHRLLILKEKLKELSEKYGEPGKIVFEIAREDFAGKTKYIKFQNDNKKEKEEAENILEKYNINITRENILRARLYKQQKWEDIYDTSEKRKIVISRLSEDYQIDHIVPRSRGGSDSLANMVLTKASLNGDKGDKTPYEWFHEKRSKDWDFYVKNVKEIFGSDRKYKRKIELLISDKASELDSRKTDLQATSYIEKAAQRLASLYFNWGMNTKGDRKRILFFTGGETASVRSSLGLNRILFPNLTDEEYKDLNQKVKKNRENDRHHALDALVLSVLPEIKLNFKKVEKKPDFFNKEFCEREINNVYPRIIKQTTPKLRETIYGLRYRLEKNKKTDKFEKAYYFVSHFDSSINNFKHLEGEKTRKKVENIFDLGIKEDFLKEISKKDLTQEKWEGFLREYTDNYTKIKKIAVIDSKRFEESEIFNSDGTMKSIIGEYGHEGAIKGQWIKGKESHQGQIVYKDEKNKWKVVPIYVFESVYLKIKEYEKKCKNIKFFRSGQLVELKKDSQGIKAGIYKLRTIITGGGTAKIEDMSNNKTFSKSIGTLIEQNGMTIYER
ncbi:MAG: hypothetical protein LBR30_05435 [Clostridioides sp.]|jgi:CRISPR-associated endonuclease Csn1|nr:hypothetical protein [Clostridioides sp.]